MYMYMYAVFSPDRIEGVVGMRILGGASVHIKAISSTPNPHQSKSSNEEKRGQYRLEHAGGEHWNFQHHRCAQDDLSGGYLIAKVVQNCIKCDISALFMLKLMAEQNKLKWLSGGWADHHDQCGHIPEHTHARLADYIAHACTMCMYMYMYHTL